MPVSRRLDYLLSAFLRPTWAWATALVFTVLSGGLFLLDEFSPGERPPMIQMLMWLPWWGWLILALITAWIALFEGGYRHWRNTAQASEREISAIKAEMLETLADKDVEIQSLTAALAQAQALPRQRIQKAEMDARVELANIVTRMRRYALRYDRTPISDAELERAGALKDRLSVHPEIAALWRKMASSEAALRILRARRSSGSLEDMVAATFEETFSPEWSAMDGASTELINWLLMRD